MTEPRSKAALLELIESKRGRWDDMVAEIGEDRMLSSPARPATGTSRTLSRT